MRIILYMKVLLILLFLTFGCNVQPRYRTGEAAKPGTEEKKPAGNPTRTYGKKPVGMSTHDFIKLGTIINSYLGEPYKGKSRLGKGLDCSELVINVFKRFNGTQLPRTTGKQYKTGTKVGRRNLRFGDLVFFRTENSKVSHVGIYIENDEFVHSSTSLGVIITSIKDDYWKKRFVGSRRVLP